MLSSWKNPVMDLPSLSVSQQFDELMIRMNRPDADKATQAALFDTPATLNKAYRPGATVSLRDLS